MALLKPLTASDRKWLQRSRRILLTGMITALIGILIGVVFADSGPYTYQTTGAIGYTNIQLHQVCRTSDNTIHIAYRGIYYHSHNNGANWTETTIFTTGNYYVAIDCTDEDNLIYAIAGYGASASQIKIAVANKAASPWTWLWGSAVVVHATYSMDDVYADSQSNFHVVMEKAGGGAVYWAHSTDGGGTWNTTDVTCASDTVITITGDSDGNIYPFMQAVGGTIKARKITYNATAHIYTDLGTCYSVSSAGAWRPSVTSLPDDRFILAYGLYDGGSGTSVYFRRSTNAADVQNWGAETEIEASGVSTSRNVGIMGINNTAYRVYYIHTGVNYKESTDSGGSWGSRQTVTTGGYDYGPRIARENMNGYLDYVFNYGVSEGRHFYYLSGATTTTTTTSTTTSTTLPSAADLSGVCSGIGDALGISDEAGCMLISFILFFAVLVPLGMLTRNFWVLLIVGLTLSGFLTAIQWLPVWLMVVLCLIISILFSSRLTGIVSRGGSDEGD